MQYEKGKLLNQMIDSGVLHSSHVIRAFKKVQRENFVRKEYVKNAYEDIPLPIAQGATISQPSTIASMIEALDAKKNQKILEVGAGSGYQAALLSEIIGEKGKVFTLEIEKDIYDFAKNNLKDCHNVTVILSDGQKGYEKESQYDRIIVAAAAKDMPLALLEQLKISGIMVIPIGTEMFRITKVLEKEAIKEFIGNYAFVPLR